MVMGVVVVLITSSLAIYYRGQAMQYYRQYIAAMDLLGRTTDNPVELEPPVLSVARQTPVPRERASEAFRPESSLAVTSPPAPVAYVQVSSNSLSERGRRGPADWMNYFRTNDPVRYAEFQQRRQEMQQRVQDAWSQSSNYFMSRDTSRMPQAELEEYNAMTMLLTQAATLNQQLQSGLPHDARHEVEAALRSNIVAVAPLLENERNREYFDAAVAMGQSEQDAAKMVGYINQISSNTSIRTILPGVRMGGGGGGGRGPN